MGRRQLEKAIATLGTGDVLVLPEWDRATRSMLDSIQIIQCVAARGALAKVLDKPYLDLTRTMGQGILAFLSAFAQDERERIVKARAGWQEGRQGGRRPIRSQTEADGTFSRPKVQAAGEWRVRQVNRSRFQLPSRHRFEPAPELGQKHSLRRYSCVWRTAAVGNTPITGHEDRPMGRVSEMPIAAVSTCRNIREQKTRYPRLGQTTEEQELWHLCKCSCSVKGSYPRMLQPFHASLRVFPDGATSSNGRIRRSWMFRASSGTGRRTPELRFATRPSRGGAQVYPPAVGAGEETRAVLIGAIPPLMLKTPSNPGGLPIEVFDELRANVVADRSQFWKDLSLPFYGYNRPGAPPRSTEPHDDTSACLRHKC